jgi:hypothetical protein
VGVEPVAVTVTVLTPAGVTGVIGVVVVAPPLPQPIDIPAAKAKLAAKSNHIIKRRASDCLRTSFLKRRRHVNEPNPIRNANERKVARAWISGN